MFIREKGTENCPRYTIYMFLRYMMITTIIIYRNIKNRRRWFLAFRPNTTGKYIRPFQMPVFFGKNISFTMYIYISKNRIHREKATGSNCTLYYDYMSSEYPFMYLWYTAEENSGYIARWIEIFLPNFIQQKKGTSIRIDMVAPCYVYNFQNNTPTYPWWRHWFVFGKI